MDLIASLNLLRNEEALTNFPVVPVIPGHEEVIARNMIPTQQMHALTSGGQGFVFAPAPMPAAPVTKVVEAPSAMIWKGVSWTGYLVSVWFILGTTSAAYSALSGLLDAIAPEPKTPAGSNPEKPIGAIFQPHKSLTKPSLPKPSAGPQAFESQGNFSASGASAEGTKA